MLDGTGFPKQGRASVGVSRQYSGTLGKIGNCQVAVTAALWTGVQAWVVGAKLYLPATWLTPAQRPRGRIPATVVFQEKWRLALSLLRQGSRSPRWWRTPSSATAPPCAACCTPSRCRTPWPCRVTPAHDWRTRRVAPEIWLLCQRDLGATPETKAYFVRLAHHRLERSSNSTPN